MSFLDVLYTILIGPLQLAFEMIYMVANKLIGHPGLSIIVLSLIMNFLVLPLYRRSDIMQEEARDIEMKLSQGVAHIKKTFAGDERMMILQTYYRQNHYKPTNALNGSISLLLEIPFFMAAYNFLSHLDAIQGVSLGPISDLASPDGLLTIGNITINILPILMTLINLISSAIYVKGFPLKTKIQLFGMAVFFLVFLYTSPAGLVFYWTLNNIFSLIKTLFYKFRNSKKVLSILFAIAGVFAIFFALFGYNTPSLKRKLLVLGIGIICEIPLLLPKIIGNIRITRQSVSETNNKKFFVMGSLFLIVLVGLLIPSTLIAASPQEFLDVAHFYNPNWYIVNTFCLSLGTFGIWFGVFYWIASSRVKCIMDKAVWILCVVMLVNYMFFGTDLGIISTNLQYEDGLAFSTLQEAANILILALIAVVMYVVSKRWKKMLPGILVTATIALIGMTGLHLITIDREVKEAKKIIENISDSTPQFELSKTGKNVIVFMLDRAMGEYIPYILNEKPELQEQFDGFVFYPNTVSHGYFTNFGTPGLFGGYEYTPLEMNKRSSESLVSKHNEALKVMPVLFMENGYEVTVCDPPYANYQWVPDLSIYDEYPEIDTYITNGRYGDTTSSEFKIKTNRRNFFCFSLMKTMPLCIQEIIYDKGAYNQSEQVPEEIQYSSQVIISDTEAEGISKNFMDSYNVLLNLSNMTNISKEKKDTFLMMSNALTHEPMLLQEPEYQPATYVNNIQYYEEDMSRFIVNGIRLEMNSYYQIQHYQTNMAAMLQMGKWFDYLRENDVYDNTRIILVADHGFRGNHIKELIYTGIESAFSDLGGCNALLMVKDFNSIGFSTVDEFMTNADVPTMAVENIIENPINPFTGEVICNTQKTEREQYIVVSPEWDTETNNGNTFLPSKWYTIENNIWDMSNWRFITEETIRPDQME